MFDRPKLGRLVRQIRIALLPLLLLASAPVLAQEAPRLTLSVDQGVPSGELRLVGKSEASGSSFSFEGLAVSPDGRWLINAGNNLELWEIDSARGIVTRRMSSASPGTSRGLAVSPDSSLVFVPNESNNQVTVFRLNADEGRLEEVAKYTEGGEDAAGNRISGLANAYDVVPSPDGRLLFVTSSGGGGALSVWSIGTTGTLTQTGMHASPHAADAAGTPDGRLLFVGSDQGRVSGDSTLGIWRVNAEASTVSLVRNLRSEQRLGRPRNIALPPSGRLLFVANPLVNRQNYLSAYRVNAAQENLESAGGLSGDIGQGGFVELADIAATEEVLIASGRVGGTLQILLLRINGNGTVSLVSREREDVYGVAVSPAGGLVFANTQGTQIIVWQVLGIPRVPAGQKVRVMVKAERALGSALTVTVQARQGSRVSTAAATLTPSGTQAEAVFSGRDLGQGEWIFSASVPEDMENIADALTARATLRIGDPLIRISNLSGVTQQGEDLNIRVSTEGHPVVANEEVTLRATQGGTEPRTVMGVLREGQTSFIATFAGGNALTAGDWVLSAESSTLPTDASSTLAVTVRPPPLIRLSNLSGVTQQGAALNIRVSTEGMVPVIRNAEVTLQATQEGVQPRTVMGLLLEGQTSVTVTFADENALTGGDWVLSAEPSILLGTDANSTLAVTVRPPPLIRLSNLSGVIPEGADLNIKVSAEGPPVLRDAQVTLQATQEGVQPRTVMGLLLEGQTSVTVTFADENALTGGDWVLSAEPSILLGTDANSTLAVTVIPPPPRLTLSVDQGVPSGELRLVRRSDASGSSSSQQGLAVSPDGRWLFNAGSNLEVWEIDSARGIVTQRMSSPRPASSPGLAVSPDSSLVFVPNSQDNQITVFRLNADNGRLAEVETYTEGGRDSAGNTVRGLINVWDVVPSPDGRLLFVTGRGGFLSGSLSVWSIDISGTLVQTDVHVSEGAADPEGLNRATGAAVTPDGRLLFVGSFGNKLERTLSIWRVDPEASAVSFVRTLSDRQRLDQPRTIVLHPSGRLLFVANFDTFLNDQVAIYRVNALQENLENVGGPRGIAIFSDITATEEVLIASHAFRASVERDPSLARISLLRINGDDTISLVSRQPTGALLPGVAASPAGGLVFSNSSDPFNDLVFPNEADGRLITVWQVLGIPRVPAGQEVRVMVNIEQAPDSLLTVMVQARQGGQVRTAAATLMPPGTQAEAVFSGSELGPGEWIFSASVSADREDAIDVSAARATLRIGRSVIRLSNLSGVILQGEGLNIRVSAEGTPVLEDAQVTLQAAQEGAQPRTVMGVLREGQTSVTVTFAGENALTGGDWVLSLLSAEPPILQTDANSTLAVTVISPLALSLSVDQGVPSGEFRLVMRSRETNPSRPGDQGLAVSPDGRWLINAATHLELWEIDSARGIVTQRMSFFHSISRPAGLAVSPDSSLVFVPDDAGNQITVFRLDADNGRLAEVETYTEGGRDSAGNTVRGLTDVWDVVPSPDGRLLFVTSGGNSQGGGGALSVWSISSAGTLTQTDVHISAGASDTEGLENAAGAAVTPDGRLLFVGSARAQRQTELDKSTLSIWRVNAEASTVSHVRTLNDRQRLARPRNIVLSPSGHLLFAMNVTPLNGGVDISVYSVKAAQKNLVPVDSVFDLERFFLDGSITATEEALIASSIASRDIAFFRINEDDTISRVSIEREGDGPFGVVASPAGGLVFSNSNNSLEFSFITVRQVLGIPRVPAGQEVRVMVNTEPAPGAALTVIVQAQQGSRVRTAAATLMPEDTQAEAVFSGSDLGQGEWVFSASVPTDMENVLNVSAVRTALRIAAPFIRISNLSGRIPERADLNVRVSTEGMIPVIGNVEVTLQATQEGAQPRMVMGLLREGQTSVTVTFARLSALTAGDWVLSLLSAEPPILLGTDANSSLAVTIGPPLPRLTLSVDQGVPSGDLRLVRISTASGTSRSLEGLAVSPDGRWLFNAGSNLEVWEIDSARGIVTQSTTSTKTGSSRGLAVSPDSRFVFVPDNVNGTITAFRLDADDGRLEEVETYTEGGRDAAENEISGLTDVWDVVPSPNSRLLFITSGGESETAGGALSVWRINPSGTLVQTDVHLSAGASNTEGLNRAAGAAVTPDGRLLFVGAEAPGSGTLSIWRVNAEASTVSHVRNLFDSQRLTRPRAIALPPSGHLLFAMNYQTNDYLSVYSVNAAQEGLTSVAPVLMGRFLDDITATEEALIASDNNAAQISLLRINENDTVSPVSRQDAGDSLYGVVASPAGGLVFSNSANGRFITVWQVLGIPRVTAGQEVRVTVNAEPAPDSLLTMIVQARQGGRISTAAATLGPSDTQADAVFPGSALGQGEWVFSVSVLTDADTENIVDVLAARATLRIGIPFIRISNLSGVIPEGADLNIRVSVEGNPVREDAEVTLRAIQEGAQPRTVMGVITEGQTSVTVTFADEKALTQGVWIVSAETSSTLLQTDANSTLAVTVGPLPPKLTLSVDQGVPSGDLRLVRRSTASGTSISRQGLAVSPDGRWLFNAGNNLEVWEIDIARGIVTQRMSAPKPGLSRGLAVSRDSSLVFVPDNENNQITVWRLNADNGRLAEVETYTEGGQDSAGNTVRGLINVWDVVPSPDGRLLFVTSGGGVSFGNSPGGALSVWSINSTSTLTQTDVHISAGASDTEGLNQAAGAAVTPDGRLLFVGSYYENQLDQSTLSIWRVNAEAATVSFVRTLRDPQRLRQPRTIALRPSGRLLFVMNYRSSNYLSVYSVNAAQENLVSVGPGLSGDPLLEDIAATEEVLIASNFSLAQISLLRINENDTVSPVSRQDAEDALHGVVASPAGSLVFSNSNDGRFITVWQVQGIPRVPAGQDVRVMVNAERAPGSALTVMVWARQGSRVSMAAATLMPRDTRAEAVFSGSALGQGEWMFSASVPADMENLADASAARATLRIDGPLIRLSNLSGLLPAGADLDIRVSTEGTPVLQDTEVTLQAAQEGAQPRTVMGLLQEEQTSVTVTFAGEKALTEGDWILSAEPSILFRTDANSTLAVTVGPPLLIRLSNLSGVIQQGADLNIRVSVEDPVLRDAEVTLRAAQEGAQPRTVMGIITGGQTSVTVTFAGENALTEGDWILSAEPSLLFRTDVNSTLAVTVRPPPLIRLSNLSGAILQGADLNIRVSAEGPPVLRDAEVTLRAAREGAQPRTATGLLREGQTSVTVTFAGRESLTEGDWVLFAEPSILLGTDANSTLAVTVGPPLPRLTLSLQETAEPVVPAGSALGITVMADRPLVQDLTVTVQAVRTAAAPATVVTAAVTIRLLAAEQMGNALFEGENALPPGQWVLTIADFIPEDSAEASTQQLQVRVGSSALGLSAPMGLFQGQDAVIEVNTEVALGVEVRVMVMATHASTPTTTASAAAVLEPSALAAEARFPANMLSLVREGTWNFEITAATPSVLITDTEAFPLVDFTETTATLIVTEEPTLLLELPPQPVDPAQPVSIRLQKSTTISEELTVDITAMRPFGGMTLTSTAMATLSPSDTTAAAVFGPGELSAGRWTLTASVRPPETVPIFPPTVTMTVRPPLLRLQRLGPASVAAGTRVTVRVEAEAMPEDEGLGVRVIARQAMRADRERSAVLGSQSDFSADVEFTSLPPGEWLLTAEAERPDAFRTEGARDTVTVEPAVLTLTPVLERVPAGESARLILGSVVPLGVAVNVTVVAEPVSLSSSLMTAVNLDEASTSAMVVYDPGELAPGIWNFNVQVMDAAVRMVANVSMATATLRIAAPLIRLANLSGEILQGAELNIRVSTEGMVPVAGDAEVTLRAMLQEGTQQRIVTGRLLEGQTSVTVTFAGEEALTGGDWTVSAETASTLLQTDVNISSLTVRVFLPPLRLTLSVDQGVPSGELRLVRLSVASESSSSEDGFAVSPDGRWLINAGRNLELWEIDSVRGIVTQRMSSPQSDSSRGLAVSPDSRFVFVTDKASTGTITVWRLNADDGTLAEVAQYTEGGEDAAENTVRGLTSVWDAVLSPDGRLLFVTSRGVSDTAGGALSVWSVNPSGTLVQTDVHLSAGALDTEGLNRAAGAAVTPDGRLLFVASFYGFRSLDSSTLGIWRVNAETSSVSFVRILSDRQRLARPRSIAFAPSGRLLFVSNQVRVEAATGTLSVYRVRVNAEEEDLASLASYGGDSFVDGNAAGLAATREVLAVTESRDGVSLWQRNDDGTLRFVSRHAAVTPIGVAASPAGGLIFSSSFDESAGISVWQVQGIPRVLAGQEVRVMVSAEPAPGSALTVMVQARQGSLVRTAAATLMPPAAQAEAVFSGSDLGYGEWIFSASVPADRADRVDRTALSAARATLRIGGPPIRISNLSGEILQGADLNIRVSTEGMVPVTGDAEVTLRAMLQEGAQQRAVTGILLEGQTSVTVTFAGENALTGGDWVLSAESPVLQTAANSTLAVTVIPLPLLTLSLQETAEPVVPAGSTLGITVMADRPLMQDLTVAVQAVRTVTAPPTVTTATVTTQLFAGEEMGNALFEGENALPPGQWVLTIAELIPEDSAEASPQELQVRVGPSALGLSAPMDLLQGQEAVIEVDTEVALGVEVRVIVMATHASAPTITASAAAVLEPSALAAEARFPANMLSLVREGTWNFEITAATPSVLITDTEAFPLVDFTGTTATLQVTVPVEPTLLLELPPQPVDPAQPVSIRLQKSAPISERLTVDITAMRPFGGMTLTRMATAMLSSSDTTAAAVFGPGALSAGRWTLTASVRPPGTVPIIPPTATMTVRPPLLRLQRLGPASVAAGTQVIVRVAAEAMPEDEGLGVRVIARQAMRADRERSAVLGSQSNFSADVEFTSLPPGEWMLTAEAERPDAFRTENARDTVTVEPAVLTLTPVLERVPAGEPARLILGSAVPLGVAVNLNVVAEPVSPLFSQQMTAVNLDEASTSTTVVYDPGELAPGIWNFNVQVIDAAVRMVADVSMATATLRIAAPLVRLANLSGEILQGAELNIRVRTEGMIPVAGDAEVTLRATLQEGTQQRTVTGRLLEGQTSVTVTFADENALTEGDWTVSAETASTLLQTDANLSSLTVIVGPQPRLLLERTGGSDIVALDETITLTLRLMPALSTTVMVTVAVTDEGSNTISEQQEALSSSLQLTFSASDLGTGRRLFTARGPAGVLEDSGAEVTVQVQEQRTITLGIDAPRSVTVGSTFEVTVGAPLPAGTTVRVAVELSSVPQEIITLSSANPIATLELTAPGTAASSPPLSLSAAPVADGIEVADPNALILTVNPSARDVRVDALRAELFLMTSVSNVPAASTFAIMVGVTVTEAAGAEIELPAETAVAVTVRFGDFESMVVSLTREMSERSVIVDVPAALAGSNLRLRADGVATGPLSVVVIGSSLQLSVDAFPVVLNLDVPDTANAPVFQGVMFPVRASADDLPQGSTLVVAVSLTGEASAATQSVSLTADTPSAVVMFEAPVTAAVVTTYTVTTDSEMMGAAVLAVTEAEPAMIFITRVNADLSGDEVFDEDDVILMTRALLTENFAARSEGFGLAGLSPIPDEQRNELQSQFDAFADVADISGNGILDAVDAIFLLRNLNATADSLRNQVNSGNNPFDYLCGSARPDACTGIESPHANITGAEGIQYEIIGERLETLRNVPQPPVLPPETSQSRSRWEI